MSCSNLCFTRLCFFVLQMSRRAWHDIHLCLVFCHLSSIFSRSVLHWLHGLPHVCTSHEEIAKYLETFKVYEKKSADLIREKIDSHDPKAQVLFIVPLFVKNSNYVVCVCFCFLFGCSFAGFELMNETQETKQNKKPKQQQQQKRFPPFSA